MTNETIVNLSGFFQKRFSILLLKSLIKYYLLLTITRLSNRIFFNLIVNLIPLIKSLYQAFIYKIHVIILFFRYILSQTSKLIKTRKIIQPYIIKAYLTFPNLKLKLYSKLFFLKIQLIEFFVFFEENLNFQPTIIFC